MAYNEGVAQRVREVLVDCDGITDDGIAEKSMFGGIAFMVGGNMCCGIVDDNLMARIGPAEYKNALAKPFVRKMDFTGKAMKGFVYVAPAGFDSDDDLKGWVDMSLAFTETLPPK